MPSQVLVVSRLLAGDQQSGSGFAIPEDSLCAVPPQIAGPATCSELT
jgi:hypothetical protein